MRIYFTADLHFDHANIIKYAHRPFLKKGDLIEKTMVWKADEIKQRRCDEMNYCLVERWNDKVNDEDLVYHIGDFAFKGSNNARYWEKQLNGDIVHIEGNHDKNNGVRTYIEKCIMHFGGKDVFG